MTKSGIAESGRAHAAAHDLLEALRVLVTYLPGSSYDVRDGVVRMVSGLFFPPFNGVAVTHPDADAVDILAAVDEFASGPLPWNVQLRAGYPAELDVALADRGLVVTGDIPLMTVHDMGAVRMATQRAPLDYARVTVTDMESYVELMSAGFEMAPEVIREFMVPALVTDPRLHLLIGRRDGVDVTTGLSIAIGEGVGIFNIATPPQHRGRGYGAAVTAELVLRAVARGATWAWLQASPMGFAVYQRLGFRTAENWRQWMPREQVGAPD